MSLCWVYVGDGHQQVLPTLGQREGIGQGVVTPSKVIDVVHSVDMPSAATVPLVLSNLQDMKVQYVPMTVLPTIVKPDTSKHFHIFVGDLCPYLQPQQLKDAFTQFGPISDCKIIQDPQTMRSKGYGFVTFVKKEDAANAIAAMNGRLLGTRVIRTNWAMRKLSLTGTSGKMASYEDVFKQSSANNCTVYCGGIMTGLTEDMIRLAFSEFGTIEEVRVFEEKGYAFIRFSDKESATEAIIRTHLTRIGGHTVKCSWGKKGEDCQQQQQQEEQTKPSATSISNLYTPSPPLHHSVSPTQQRITESSICPSYGVNVHNNTHLYNRSAYTTTQTTSQQCGSFRYLTFEQECSLPKPGDCPTLLPQQPVTASYGLCDYRVVPAVPLATVTSPFATLSQPSLSTQLVPNSVQTAAGIVGLYTLQPLD